MKKPKSVKQAEHLKRARAARKPAYDKKNDALQKLKIIEQKYNLEYLIHGKQLIEEPVVEHPEPPRVAEKVLQEPIEKVIPPEPEQNPKTRVTYWGLLNQNPRLFLQEGLGV